MKEQINNINKTRIINVVLFGSTGMIGQAVLQECLDHSAVQSVLIVNRKSSNRKHEKLKELILPDFSDPGGIEKEFSNYNTCFFYLGVSAVGLTEAVYHATTYELTIRVAESIIKVNKEFTFCYISGKGTDSTEKGRFMWARVKGRLENKLLSMPFKAAYMFRPGYIQPMKGIKSRTKWYNIFYLFFKPLYFILKPFKGIVTDTTSLARAMIYVATNGYEKNILESEDINTAAHQR